MAYRADKLRDRGYHRWEPCRFERAECHDISMFVVTRVDDKQGDVSEYENDVQGDADSDLHLVVRLWLAPLRRPLR